jgi:DNA polymerase III subunit epsilon
MARFSSLVRPSCPIPAEATDVHGISDADVASAPRFAEIAPGLLELLESVVFVAHNAAFDLA